MIIAWFLFPIVMLAVCLGLGLAVERLAGVRLPGAVLPSAGLALLIVVAVLMTYQNATAKFTTALVIVLAIAGYGSSIRRVPELRPDPVVLAVAGSLYAILAAPVVLSGNASFLGYGVLNDSAVHFALINQLLAHGQDLSGVHSSSLLNLLGGYLDHGYPVGSQVALGAIRPLVDQNVAWVFQPYLAVILSLTGVLIYQLLHGAVALRPMRALCAFVAAQTGLVYAYYLEASIKEIATVWVIALIVVLVFHALEQELTLRRLAPLVIAAVAAFGVLNVTIVPWLGVPLAVFALLALRRSLPAIARAPRRRVALLTGAGLLLLAAIASPIIATAPSAFDTASSQLTRSGDLGNLIKPLSKWEMLGIWPSGDFRIPVAHYAYQIPHAALLDRALIGLAVASAVVGTAWALRRRFGAPLLLLAGSGLGAMYLLSRASPYASGKVMMICSVAITVMVMLGAASLVELGRRYGRFAALPGAVLALVLTTGVLWTNVDAYGGAQLAPRSAYAELEYIGERFAGQGPAFYNIGDEFGVDFLGPEVPTDPALEPPLARRGLLARTTLVQTHAPWNINELDERYLQSFRLLVLARSPQASRPPADYALAYRGHVFDVWRRTAAPRVLLHVPLEGVAPCSAALALARQAAHEQARLAYATRPQPVLLSATELRYSGRAHQSPGRGGVPEEAVSLRTAGTLVAGVQVRRGGRYAIWLDGAFSRQVEVSIDGRRAGWASYAVGPPGLLLRVGSLDLSAGAHSVSVIVPDEILAPGVRSIEVLGAIVLAPEEAGSLQEVQPTRARSLCGRALDWVEVVR